MACCAFALFLLAQICAPFAALARKLGFDPSLPRDSAVDWNPGGAAMISAPAARAFPTAARLRKFALAFLAVDVAILAALAIPAAASVATDHAPSPNSIEAMLHRSICGTNGWAD